MEQLRAAAEGVDPLYVGAVLALLGVITGGAVALLSQVFAARRYDDRLKRALRAEVRQNAIALEPFAAGPTSLDPIPHSRRDAWVSAQALDWPEQSFRAIAAAYTLVDRYESFVQMITAREVSGTQALHLRMQAQGVATGAIPLLTAAEKLLR